MTKKSKQDSSRASARASEKAAAKQARQQENAAASGPPTDPTTQMQHLTMSILTQIVGLHSATAACVARNFGEYVASLIANGTLQQQHELVTVAWRIGGEINARAAKEAKEAAKTEESPPPAPPEA